MSTKTIILATMPNNRLGNLHLTQSPAFRKTIVPGGPGKSLLGIRPATDRHEKPVAIEIKLENQLLETTQDQESHNTRKRQRLDHLTMEEKLMRRKLKNRVAAQTARDRKKARMDELEDLVAILEKEMDKLRDENSRLKNFTILLETENKLLKEKVECQNEVKLLSPVTTELPLVKREVEEDRTRGVEDVGSIEHAEGAGSDDPLFSLEEALRLLENDNNESDDLFDFLQQCDQDFFDSSNEGNLTKPEEQTEAAPPCKRRRAECSSPLVGASSTELESIKELIHFDHVYYKERKEDIDPVKVEIEEAVVEIVDTDSQDSSVSYQKTISTVGREYLNAPSIIITDNFTGDIAQNSDCGDSDCEIIEDTSTDRLNLKTVDTNIFLNSPCGSSGNESGYDSPKTPSTGTSSLTDDDFEESFSELSELFPMLM